MKPIIQLSIALLIGFVSFLIATYLYAITGYLTPESPLLITLIYLTNICCYFTIWLSLKTKWELYRVRVSLFPSIFKVLVAIPTCIIRSKGWE
jgi:hypothetical protein